MEYSPAFVYSGLPLVAIAGRPNVGKSTLFNRLLRRRRAITSPVPGVTRDPVEAQAFLAGKPVRLVDTGGFRLKEDGRPAGMERMVTERSRAVMEEADLVVLVLEAGDINAEDEELIALLRPRWERVIAAVNKTEGGRREAEAWNALHYGFSFLLPISAEHGDHIGELEEAITARLDFSALRMEPDAAAEPPLALALLGKPNTGKSTLANRLTAAGASLVSSEPGTTRDVIEGSFRFRNRTIRVLDTAGIRRKSKVTENIEYYSVRRALETLEEACVVILLVDAQEGLTDQDKKIAAHACEKGRGIIFALNKWDTMPQLRNAENAAKDRIHYFFGQMDWAPIVPLSAKTGAGIDELLTVTLRVESQLCRRTETAVLNQALARWIEETPPPSGPRTRFSIKYAVQTSANPVKFTLFVSRPAAVTPAYTAYLRNKIRKDLGYSLIPMELELRPSRKPRSPPGKRG